MPCLCQYIATDLGLRVKASLDIKDNENFNEDKEKGTNEVLTGEVNASELAICRVELQSLKRELSSYRISGENMEVLMKKMIEEQHYLVTEIFGLKKTNEDMRSQQVTDRNNQAIERSTLLRELHEIKTHLRERSSVMEKVLQQNQALTNALKDANEKIYLMGIKYLKLQGSRFKNHEKEEETKSFNSNFSDETFVSD